MKKKSKGLDYSNEPRKFEDGETVLINRPHLWSGCSGVVVFFKEGLHRVRIEAKEGGSTCSHFHADVPGGMLEVYL